MGQKQEIQYSYLLAIAIFLLGTNTSQAQSDSARCKEFQKLLDRNGLEISAKLDHDFIFTEEMLEPVIVLKNTTNSILEIPYIHPATRLLMAKHVDSFAGVKPDLENCSIQTEKLLPGSQKTFPINYDVGPLFPGFEKDKEQFIGQADAEPGKRLRSLRIGTSSIPLSYISVAPKLESTACVDVLAHSKSMNLKISSENTEKCLVASIFSFEGKYYLMASVGSIEVSHYAEIIESSMRLKGTPLAKTLASISAIRVAEFDQPIQFDPKSTKEVIQASNFQLFLADGTKLSLKQIEAKWEERRQLGRL
jgi:hypothetical protein